MINVKLKQVNDDI